MLLTVILAVYGICYVRAYFKDVVVFLDVSSALIVVETVGRLPLSGCRDTLNVVFVDNSTGHLSDSVDTAAVVETVKAVDNTVVAD